MANDFTVPSDVMFSLAQGEGYMGPKNERLIGEFLAASPGAAMRVGKQVERAKQIMQTSMKYSQGGLVRNPETGEWEYDPGGNTGTTGTTTATGTGTNTDPFRTRNDGTNIYRGELPQSGSQINDIYQPMDGSGALYWDGTQWSNTQRQPGQIEDYNNAMLGDTYVNSAGTTMVLTQTGWVPESAAGTEGVRGVQDPEEETTGWSPQVQGSLTAEQIERRLPRVRERLASAQARLAADPENTALQEEVDRLQRRAQGLTEAYLTNVMPSVGELTGTAVSDPSSLVTNVDVATVEENPDQLIAEGTGDAGDITAAETRTVGRTAEATAADTVEPASYQAAEIGQEQIREILNEEMRDPVTGQPTAAATVQGQMASLMEQFEGGATPPWASGAMREAMAIMQKRGMGASSQAGMAITQAAMESALQIAMPDAQINAQFELQNLQNTQQHQIFRTQQRIGVMLSDQAAENAAQQFNAASENQVNTFMAELETTVSRFNAEQINGMRQFNAGQTNSTRQFNANLQAMREQFNATQSLAIEQANTAWRQQIALTNTGQQHAANMQNAMLATGLTQAAMGELWQRERDIMNFAFTATENQLDRDLELLLADREIGASRTSSLWGAIGSIGGAIVGNWFS